MTEIELRHIISKMGITPTKLASLIGMAPSTILKYESGQRDIPYKTELAIQHVFEKHKKKKKHDAQIRFRICR